MARHPYYRSLIAIGVVGVVAAHLGGRAAVAGPGAALAARRAGAGRAGTPIIGAVMTFDIARTSNPPRRLGSAIGVVNGGAFLGTLIAVMGIGLVLQCDHPGGSTDYSLDSFKWAFAIQYVLWAIGDRADAALPAPDDPRAHRARPRRLRGAAPRRPPVATDVRRAA